MKSMTGFGTGKKGIYTVEIRALNHRYCDILTKLPPHLLQIENAVRMLIKDYVNRGRIEISVDEQSAKLNQIKVNEDIVKKYFSAINKLKHKYNIKGEIQLSDVIKLPGVIEHSNEISNKKIIWEYIKSAAIDALESMMTMKIEEGKNIKHYILCRLKDIGRLMDANDKMVKASKSKSKKSGTANKNDNGISQSKALASSNMVTNRDNNNSTGLYSSIGKDKQDISEEISRILSHVKQFKKVISEDCPMIGRKMDFITQEMQRETNTLLAKTSNMKILKNAIEIKEIVEQIREQVQNVE